MTVAGKGSEGQPSENNQKRKAVESVRWKLYVEEKKICSVEGNGR